MTPDAYAEQDAQDTLRLEELAKLTATGDGFERRRELMGELITGWARYFVPWLVLRAGQEVGEEAASRAMERLVRLLLRKQRFDHPWGKVAWTTAKFEMYSVLRERKARSQREAVVAEPFPDPDDAPAYELSLASEDGPEFDVARLHAALATLSSDDRRLVDLVFFEDRDRADAAAELGVTPETFSVRKLRALNRLAHAYNDLNVTNETDSAEM